MADINLNDFVHQAAMLTTDRKFELILNYVDDIYFRLANLDEDSQAIQAVLDRMPETVPLSKVLVVGVIGGALGAGIAMQVLKDDTVLRTKFQQWRKRKEVNPNGGS